MIDNAIAPLVPSRTSSKTSFSLAGIGTKLFTGIAVLLLIPAMLLVGLVAILVPCLLSVPVCGPVIRPPRIDSRR